MPAPPVLPVDNPGPFTLAAIDAAPATYAYYTRAFQERWPSAFRWTAYAYRTALVGLLPTCDPFFHLYMPTYEPEGDLLWFLRDYLGALLLSRPACANEWACYTYGTTTQLYARNPLVRWIQPSNRPPDAKPSTVWMGVGFVLHADPGPYRFREQSWTPKSRRALMQEQATFARILCDALENPECRPLMHPRNIAIVRAFGQTARPVLESIWQRLMRS